MKVTIDPKKCVSCGACEQLTEGLIKVPDNKPAKLTSKPNFKDPNVRENFKMAADICPQGAIIISS